MTKVLGLDAQGSGVLPWIGYFLAAIALLLGLGVAARAIAVFRAMHDASGAPVTPPQEIEVVREEPPPPPPPPPEPVAKAEAPAPPPREAPPAPSPAQASKVLTQEPDPNEPVDLTGNTIISGNAEAYAGGVTSANGASKNAVRGLTSPTGAPAAVAAPASTGPDRSRSASLGGGEDWKNCPFPPEADTAQIDEAEVTIQIEVRPDGTPASVRALSDPGNGFGREAVRYAMTRRYTSALDRSGTPIPGAFKVRVRFSR